MTMYYSVKFGSKKSSTSIDMVETVIYDYTSHNCDHDLEDGKPIFSHDTLAHDDASPYHKFGCKRFSG